MPHQRKITRPELQGQPFRLIIDFPSYEDANAAKELLLPMDLGPLTLRAKEDYFRPTVGQSPRMRAMRKALAAHRSFDHEMIGEALADCGYSSTKYTISNFTELAQKYSVIKALEKGIYEFLPESYQAIHVDAQCAACQPEPLITSCQPEPLQCPSA